MEWKGAGEHEDYGHDLDKSVERWRQSMSGLLGINAPPRPYAPSLIVVDMQRYFLEKGAPAYLPASRHVLGRVQRVIDAFSKARRPIFATRYKSSRDDVDPTVEWWGVRLDPTSELTAIDPRVRLPKDTVILDKHLYGAFESTDIGARLKELGADSVFVCGVMTDLCCETTAREAFQRGFRVHVIADGTATINERLQVSALATLAHGFAFIVTADETVGMVSAADG
ncbi:MAG: cysteine hydrolase [Euryarchaeota archaeon]|nr:cysteine hydrolase [Euryarchaeota archaeon]